MPLFRQRGWKPIHAAYLLEEESQLDSSGKQFAILAYNLSPATSIYSVVRSDLTFLLHSALRYLRRR